MKVAPSQRVQFVDGLTLMISEKLVLVMSNVALTAEVSFLLPAEGHSRTLLALIAYGFPRVILFLTV